MHSADSLSIAIQMFFNIVAAGGAYALVATGYTIVHSTLKFINFQHGYTVALGAYITYALAITWKQNFVLAAALAILAAATGGILIEKIGYKPLRKSSRLTPLLVSLGISSILQSLILLGWGPAYQSFNIAATPLVIYGATVTSNELLMVVLSMLALLALHLFLTRTKLGKAMRAVSDNPEAAAILGINTDGIISSIFALASGLAALSGVLIGLEFYIQPTMGFPIIIRTLAAVALGGIGNIPGAIVGSYTIAFVENMGVSFVSAAYRDAYAYVILVLALLLKPRGLLGGRRGDPSVVS